MGFGSARTFDQRRDGDAFGDQDDEAETNKDGVHNRVGENGTSTLSPNANAKATAAAMGGRGGLAPPQSAPPILRLAAAAAAAASTAGVAGLLDGAEVGSSSSLPLSSTSDAVPSPSPFASFASSSSLSSSSSSHTPSSPFAMPTRFAAVYARGPQALLLTPANKGHQLHASSSEAVDVVAKQGTSLVSSASTASTTSAAASASSEAAATAVAAAAEAVKQRQSTEALAAAALGLRAQPLPLSAAYPFTSVAPPQPSAPPPLLRAGSMAGAQPPLQGSKVWRGFRRECASARVAAMCM
jgi:hypothetical protein